jgi:hypothetical protein
LAGGFSPACISHPGCSFLRVTSTLRFLDEIRRDEKRFFSPVPRELPGIAVNETDQLAILHALQPYYDSQPFHAEKTRNLRYFFENPNYSYSDAIFLHCMIRHARPRRIIEIGSGYSSCVTLDTNEIFFDNQITCTFAEPHPQLLRSLLRDDDFGRIEILDVTFKKSRWIGFSLSRQMTFYLSILRMSQRSVAT